MDRETEKAKLITSLRETCDSLLQQDDNTLLRERHMGELLTFSELKHDLAEVREFYSLVKTTPLERLSFASLYKIQESMNKIADGYQKVLDFKIDQPNPSQARDQVVKAVRSASDEALRDVAPYVSLAMAYQATSDDSLQNLKKQLEDQQIAGDLLMTDLKKAQDDANQIVAAMKEASGQAGVSKQSKFFEDLAKSNSKRSIGWLAFVAACVVIFASCAIGWKVPVPYIAETDSSEIIILKLVPAIFPHLLIASLLLVAIIVGIKLFSAERHNATVNSHRKTSLETFNAFVEASVRPEVKEAVLLQATQSIFAPQATGYLKGPIDIQQVGLGMFGISGKVGESDK